MAVAKESIDHFANVKLSARSAYVYDIVDQKVLYTYNENEVLPLASLTKIMTAVTASELAPRNTLIRITDNDLKSTGDTGLKNGEVWTLARLLQYTLVVSSNDGAAAVASSLGFLADKTYDYDRNKAFVNAMNKKAAELGLSSMKYFNASGLDESLETAGGYGSAKDVAHLITYALKHNRDIIEPTRYQSFETESEDKVVHVVNNTDIIAEEIPGLIAGKTGYTNLAGGNLAIVFDAGIQRPIAVVVLGSTFQGRFDDVKTLVNASIGAINND